MALQTRPGSIDHQFDTPERIARYLEAAFEDGDPALIAAAIGDAARAHGTTELSKNTGLAREALYRSLSAEGDSGLAIMLRAPKALGVRLIAVEETA